MCLPLALTLTPTRTHPTRRAIWSPLAGELHDGTLVIVQGRREADAYAVQLVRDERGDLLALLARQDADGSVYECRRVEAGWACTCPGHGRHGHGKHSDGLAAVEGEGMLDG